MEGIEALLIPGDSQIRGEILRCNEATQVFGLSLTGEEAAGLAKTRTDCLRKYGRVEFSGGAMEKIIEKFCDSPYLDSRSYADTLNQLAEDFYYFKNEALEGLSDDELLDAMRAAFDGSCYGSAEQLRGRELEVLAQEARFAGCVQDQEEDNAREIAEYFGGELNGSDE